MIVPFTANLYGNSREEKWTVILVIRAISSAGRAPRLHRDCRQFDPVIAHHSLHHHPAFTDIIYTLVSHRSPPYHPLSSSRTCRHRGAPTVTPVHTVIIAHLSSPWCTHCHHHTHCHHRTPTVIPALGRGSSTTYKDLLLI